MRSKYIKLIPLIIAGVFLTPPAWTSDRTYSMTLADFEQPDSADKFIPMQNNPQKVTWVNDPKLTIEGKGSGRWYVPIAGKGENMWPRATFHLPENMQNWEAFDVLELDIVNLDKTESRFGINIYDNEGNAYGSYTRPVAPGRSVFRWDLPDAVRQRPIHRIMLVNNNPVREYTLYIDNIRISATGESFRKRLERQLTRLQADWQESLWQKAGMQQEFSSLKNSLLSMKNSSADLKHLLQKFNDFNHQYPEIKKRLITKLCENSINEFSSKYPRNKVWGYGWTDGLQKVYRKDLPFMGKIGGTAEVSLGKRETEGTQIVLRSYRDLQNVRLEAGPLKNSANNAILPGANVQIAVVGHVKTLPVPYPTDPAEWHPDPLLGYLQKIPLEKDVWQAFFLDIKTTPDTLPGVYEGVITAKADNVEDLHIPLKVKVWNFTLPEELSHPRLVNFHTDGNHTIYTENENVQAEFIKFRENKIPLEKLSPEARKLWDLELVTWDLLLDHLICPNALYITKRQHKINDILKWDARRASCYNITYVPPRQVAKGQKYPDWSRRIVLKNLSALIPDLRKHDLMKKSYLYSFDEIGDEKFFSALDVLSEIKKTYPDIRTVTTAYDPDFGRTNGLDKVIDCWVPQVERFEEQKDLIRQIQQSGKQVWYYSCLWDPGMDMLTEKPLTSVRLLVGLNQIRLGSDGFLYYSVNSGQWQHKPITADTPLTEHNGRGCGKFNGEGLLIYATKAGPQPSIRLKAFRDGLEDIEYCYLLKKIPADRMTAQDRNKREELLKIPSAVITNLEIYDQTGEATNHWRNQAGEILERYSKHLPAEPVKPATPTASNTAQKTAGVQRIHPQNKQVTLQLQSSPKVCKTGEKATFTIKALNNGKLINSGSVTLNISNSGGMPFDKKIIHFANSNPAVISITYDRPAVISAQLSDLCDARGNLMELRSYPRAAAAFEPEKITPAEAVPADFMNFWQKHLLKVKSSTVSVAPMPGKNYKNHDAFLLTANLPEEEKFHAVMLVPKSSGKHAISMVIPGAGPGNGVLWPADYEKDKILVQAHVHKYPPSVKRRENQQALADYEKALGMSYAYENAADPDRYFYRRVICGLNVVADYLASRSDCDGKNFHVSGSSQGGALTLALTALNKNITAAAVNVPAMCDHQGWKAGREPGWPGFHWHGYDAVAPYYDACNFASYITVPVFMSIGYLDKIAPPAGGYAAFNQLQGPKELMPMYNRGHEIPKEYHVKSEAFFKQQLK